MACLTAATAAAVNSGVSVIRVGSSAVVPNLAWASQILARHRRSAHRSAERRRRHSPGRRRSPAPAHRPPAVRPAGHGAQLRARTTSAMRRASTITACSARRWVPSKICAAVMAKRAHQRVSVTFLSSGGVSGSKTARPRDPRPAQVARHHRAEELRRRMPRCALAGRKIAPGPPPREHPGTGRRQRRGAVIERVGRPHRAAGTTAPGIRRARSGSGHAALRPRCRARHAGTRSPSASAPLPSRPDSRCRGR